MVEILLNGNISLHEGDVVLLKSHEECERANILAPFYLPRMKSWTGKEQTIDIIIRLDQNTKVFYIKNCPYLWKTEAIAEIIYPKAKIIFPKLDDLSITTNSLIF